MGTDRRVKDLQQLTGLTPRELADVLAKNPRAYMGVKGAVAERHLRKQLKKLQSTNKIEHFRKGEGDAAKDFYVKVRGRRREVVVECKNVEVIKLSRRGTIADYLQFLIARRQIKRIAGLSETLPKTELEKYRRELPQHLRESGISLYEFSAGRRTRRFLARGTQAYLEQFQREPLTIDLQRTRHSKKKGSAKERWYEFSEFDVLAACLFSRTTKWEFVYCAARYLPAHPKDRRRIKPKVKIDPETWTADFTEAVARLTRRKR